MIRELILIAVLPAALMAQMGSTLEAKMVRVKIDRPATQQGVDLYPDREQPLELSS